MKKDSYSISAAYKHCIGEKQTVRWDKVVWNRLSISKWRFIFWLAIQNKLKTKALLFSKKIIQDDLCLLCGSHAETVQHLFFACHLSQKCLIKILKWLGIHIKINSILKLYHHKWKILYRKKNVVFVVLTCLIHKIWLARNNAVWKGFVTTIKRIF